MAKENHIPLFGFTNQHRISKGQATMNDFYNEFKRYGFADAYIVHTGWMEIVIVINQNQVFY
ncbi:hypothetical protein [Paracerasibacillus soli]|uniref:Uncharacterized protein n=1 Tax=Paracerasibacillus soli TaxID=480284 RepID=A0ABU5CWD7_9BACI|nr:hypothetical protein [Virgibacillus soli]MDY0410171.1 hypothetical protein [Virgibacillus soli]